jgi:hypothetical protein
LADWDEEPDEDCLLELFREEELLLERLLLPFKRDWELVLELDELEFAEERA